jgi:hypothetical protein
MSAKIKPTARQKSIFFIHLVIFLIASAVQLLTYDMGAEGWVYPWPAWTVAAWGLSLIGHWCAVYTSFEDPGMDEYLRQEKNG